MSQQDVPEDMLSSKPRIPITDKEWKRMALHLIEKLHKRITLLEKHVSKRITLLEKQVSNLGANE